MSLTLVIGNKNYSSWSLRPWLFLKYHNIPFTEVRIPLYRDDSKSKILDYSPAGKVPILLDEQITVWDSLAILDYLAERFPQTQGWPEQAAQRALARSLAAEMHSGFSQLRSHCGMNCHRPPASKQLPEAVQADVERIGQIWQQCRQDYSEHGPWLFGRFSIVDAMFAPVALRFYSYQIATNRVAQAYINTVLENPALREWLEAGKQETEIIAAFE
ncbi:MAG: glutathione S-transferase family protein [Methylococcales bacterium]